MRHIYFDHAATTATDPKIVKSMLEYMTSEFGNPSSIHYFGRRTRRAVAESRQNVAALIGAEPEEIFFTSGGSESDNFALKGIAFANKERGNHIITTCIEHHAILHTCEWLEKEGFKVSYLPVDANGKVDIAAIKAAVTDKTILISVMFANNEVGTIEPIAKIGAFARQAGIYFHTDAVQAVGHVEIDVKNLNIDLLSLSGHKLYGPKGIGALYIRRGVKIETVQHGGAQERGMRAGTENVPGIVGLGLAARKAGADLVEENNRLTGLRDKLIHVIESEIPDVKLNGHRQDRLPGNVNFSFSGIDGEPLLLNLDMQGIAASSGSACMAGSMEPSHVLLAMGLTSEMAQSSLRLTLGRENTDANIDTLLELLPKIVKKIRSLKNNC
ncbi:MAG: cysteine desulfurase NifS [Selenomonadaceae bacterium]